MERPVIVACNRQGSLEIEPVSAKHEVDDLNIQISDERRTRLLGLDLQQALVLETGPLTASGVPQERHMEIQHSSGMSYTAGDYLAVLPVNPLRNVHREIARLRLPWDALITIRETSHTTLPKGKPLVLFKVLSALVELPQRATSMQVQKVAGTLAEPSSMAKLERLAGDEFKAEVIDKNTSLFDVLERYPTVHLSLGQFLDFLHGTRIRQHSISFSRLEYPSRCTITYTVLNAPIGGASVDGTGQFSGVSSSYLHNRD